MTSNSPYDAVHPFSLSVTPAVPSVVGEASSRHALDAFERTKRPGVQAEVRIERIPACRNGCPADRVRIAGDGPQGTDHA